MGDGQVALYQTEDVGTMTN